MKNLLLYLPFLIPIVVVELALAVTALIHVLRHRTYRFGNRVFWIIVVLVLEIVGPILYFAVGREDD